MPAPQYPRTPYSLNLAFTSAMVLTGPATFMAFHGRSDQDE